MAALDRALQTGAAALADRRTGQKGLFDSADDDTAADAGSANLPDLREWDDRQKLANEKESLGYYLTSHPLAEHADTLRLYTTHSPAAAATLPHRTEVVLGGMLSAVKLSHTKNHRPGTTNTKYAMFDLEGLEGTLRCIVWPEEYANHGQLVAADAILVVCGTVDRRPGSEESNLIVNKIIPLDQLAARYTRGMEIRLAENDRGLERLEKLYEILRGYPGNCAVQLVLSLADGTEVAIKSQNIRVAIQPELTERIDDLLGPGQVRLLTSRPTSGPKPNTGGPNGAARRMAAV